MSVKLIKAMKLEQVASIDAQRTDADWEEEWEERWNEVQNCWTELNGDDQRDLLNELRRIVPKEQIKNGAEWFEQHVHPSRAPAHLRGAAKILLLGQLEASVDGEPPPHDVVWADLRAEMEAKLAPLTTAEEVTEGDPKLSRRSHASAALDYLHETQKFIVGLTDGLHGEERRAVMEHAAALMHLCYSAGYRARSALGKADEASAVLWEKEAPTVRARRQGAEQSGKQTAIAAKEYRRAIIQAVERRVSEGQNVKEACRFVFRTDGLGNSAAAIRKMWYRHGKSVER